MMCSDIDPGPYLKVKGHTRHLKVRVHMLQSVLCITYALMDYHIMWYKCCPHWDDVQWPWSLSIPQRSRSYKTFKGLITHACVCALTCLPDNVWVLSWRFFTYDPFYTCWNSTERTNRSACGYILLPNQFTNKTIKVWFL